jgi:hypothetical protein
MIFLRRPYFHYRLKNINEKKQTFSFVVGLSNFEPELPEMETSKLNVQSEFDDEVRLSNKAEVSF